MRKTSRESTLKAYNHLEHNRYLVSKKGLYLSLQIYCKRKGIDMDDITPTTFFLTSGNCERELGKFATKVKALASDDGSDKATKLPAIVASSSDDKDAATAAKVDDDSGSKNVWILKPAAGSNQGDGIRVLAGSDVVEQVMEVVKSGGEEDVQGGRGGQRGWNDFGWIAQKYIERPLLVNGRKFDLRIYVCLLLPLPGEAGEAAGPAGGVHSDGHDERTLQAFMYEDGYVRTSSTPYNLDLSKLTDTRVHLTNDAVQKHCDNYAEEGYCKV
jgi:tubulin polyglutamylase TTLL1